VSSKHRIVHLVATPDAQDASSVRWYVRYVWLDRGATRDRVVVSGVTQRPYGEGVRASLARVLLDAAAELAGDGRQDRD
jgi:hypothetical protein